jgi:pyruvate dehydrogenase (quinone)
VSTSGPAWDEALAADRPVLYEAITDPEVPPLPPHITLEQAHYYLTALVGDPDRGAMIMESLKQKLAGFVPGR